MTGHKLSRISQTDTIPIREPSGGRVAILWVMRKLDGKTQSLSHLYQTIVLMVYIGMSEERFFFTNMLIPIVHCELPEEILFGILESFYRFI